MVNFSWRSWLHAAVTRVVRQKRRQPRTAQTPRVEGLESRTLLTNNLPVAVDDVAYNVDEDGTLLASSVLDNDTDDDGDTIDVAILDQGPAHGSLTLNEDGTFSYTPNANYHGTDSFTYFAYDSANDELSATPATVTITVNSINDAPVASASSFSVTKNLGHSGSVSATDVDGDSLTYSLGSTSPTHGSLTLNSDGTFTYTPDTGYVGPDSFSFLANDGTEDSAEATVSISVLNTAPAAVSDSLTTDEDVPLTGTLAGIDADGDDLTFAAGSVLPMHGSVAINADGSFTYTPAANFFGTDSFSFVVNDGLDDSAEGVVTITISSVNDAPVAIPAIYTAAKNVELSGTLSGSDVEGEPLTFSAGSVAASHGLVSIQSDGSFSYLPDAGYVGQDEFTFLVNDGTEDSVEATVLITIVNTAPVADAGSFTTDEDTELTGNLTGSDVNGDTFTFSLGSVTPAHGSVVINEDGSFTYTPADDYFGADSFSFLVNDGDSDSAEATVTITIAPVNDAPTATAASFTVQKNVEYNGVLSGADVDGDDLTFSAGTLDPAHGTVVFFPDGSFTYTPTAGYVGTDEFSFLVSDGALDSVEAVVSITIVNSAPVASASSFTTAEDTELTGSLAGSDINGDDVTYTLGTGPTHGSVVVNTDGTFSYTPAADYNGNDSFTFFVNDGELDSGLATVTITLTPVNDAPVANSATYSVRVNVGRAGTLGATDIDGDDVTFAAGSVTPAHGSVLINPDGSFLYIPDTDYVGTDSFSFVANDGTLDSGEAVITINIVDNAVPVADGTSFVTDEDTPYSGTLTGSDGESDPLTFYAGSLAPAHGSLVVNADGTFTYTPAADFHGSDSFTFYVNDGYGNSEEALVTVTVTAVNDAPVAHTGSFTIAEDGTLAGSLSGTDVDGDTLSYRIGSVTPQHGTLEINSDGTFTYTPAANYFGSDSFSFIVHDGVLESNEALVTITIAPVNDVPVADSASFTIAEDSELTGNLTGSDIEGDDLTFAAGSIAPLHGTVVVNADGSFTYTPAADYHGSDTFSFVVSDGSATSSEAIVTVTITAVNDAPIAIGTSYTISRNVPLLGSLSGTDIDGDDLTYSAGSIAAQHGVVVINTDGTFSYTPDQDYIGPDSFSFIVNDGTVDSTEATISINVASNTLPVADSQAVSVTEDGVLTGALTASDDDGDDLTFALGSVHPSHGTVEIGTDGSFTYTPDANFHGTDTFSFYVNDGIGNSEEATVTITVTSVNDAPIATAASVTTEEDTDLHGTLTGSDVDGDSLTFAIGSVTPSHGTVVINSDGTFTYTPSGNYFGSDSFTFTVSDGTVTSAEATVTVTITAVNDLPVVVDGSAVTDRGVAYTGSLSPLGMDVEGDELSYSVVTGPAHGTLSLNPDGVFLYTPDAGFSGTDTFTFRASDGHGFSNTATFTMTVAAVDQPLTLSLPSATAHISRTSTKIQIDTAASVNDPDTVVSYANARITAAILSGNTAADTKSGRVILGVHNQGTGPGLVKVKGTKIYFDGSSTAIAKITSGKKGQPYVITFTSAATQAAVNAVLKQLSVQASKKASTGVRTIGIQVTAGGQTAQATKDVEVI